MGRPPHVVTTDAALLDASLGDRYSSVRATTELLAAPLGPEDQTVQTMPDVSPTKWHRAHVTWFFETFLALPHLPGYVAHHPGYAYLFNSYYEAVGDRHPRARRGLLSRPTAEEVGAYRHHVDVAMRSLLDRDPGADVRELVALGLHHEEQHQELLVMDAKHVLGTNPLRPAYALESPRAAGRPGGWTSHEGGIVPIGAPVVGFAFDNERPRHDQLLQPFEIGGSLVTCGDWQAFIDDGGYRRPELWMSEGWAVAQAEGWEAPLYWRRADDGWCRYALSGERPVRCHEPVCHVSWFEADAYARWAGARLPTEAEWEAASPPPPGPDAVDLGALQPWDASTGWYGQVWQWTASPYTPYPGFRPAAGAVGEYNGKFMVNQQVLRGSSVATPAGHARRTYRNFFPASARWAFSGLRLAR